MNRLGIMRARICSFGQQGLAYVNHLLLHSGQQVRHRHARVVGTRTTGRAGFDGTAQGAQSPGAHRQRAALQVVRGRRQQQGVALPPGLAQKIGLRGGFDQELIDQHRHDAGGAVGIASRNGTIRGGRASPFLVAIDTGMGMWQSACRTRSPFCAVFATSTPVHATHSVRGVQNARFRMTLTRTAVSFELSRLNMPQPLWQSLACYLVTYDQSATLVVEDSRTIACVMKHYLQLRSPKFCSQPTEIGLETARRVPSGGHRDGSEHAGHGGLSMVRAPAPTRGPVYAICMVTSTSALTASARRAVAPADYILKPMEPRTLAARVRTVMERAEQSHA